MNTPKLIFLFLISLLPSLAATAGEAPEGFTDLINDGGLKNFRTYNKEQANPQWSIKNGILCVEGEGGGDLITRKEYENFEMHLEWKIPSKRNSGIFFGAKESSRAIYQDAVEMQILGNEGFPDWEEVHLAGAVYGISPSKREWAKPDGDWNEVRIRKKNGIVEFFFNGHQVAKHDLNSEKFSDAVAKTKYKDWPQFGKHEKGHIGFQDHGDSSGLSIRNLYIKEL